MNSVLVVDGYEDSRSLVAKVCRRKLGLRVHEAATGTEALVWLQKWQPRLIVIDLYLPDMPGEELLQHVRQNPELAEIPVIGICSLLLPEVQERLMAAGLHTCLGKPYDVMCLAETLRRCLAGCPAGNDS